MRVKSIKFFPIVFPQIWWGWFWFRPRWKLGCFFFWLNMRIEFEFKKSNK